MEENIMIEEVRERTALSNRTRAEVAANGLRHRRATDQEIARKHGPVRALKMNAPATWETLMSVSRELRSEYVYRLRTVYKARMKDLVAMFGVSQPTIWRNIDQIALQEGGYRGHKPADEWLNFIGQTQAPDPEPTPEPTPEPEHTPEPTPEPELSRAIYEGSLEDLLALLAKVKVQVKVTVVVEK